MQYLCFQDGVRYLYFSLYVVITTKLIQSLNKEKNFTVNKTSYEEKLSIYIQAMEVCWLKKNVSISKLWLSAIKSMFNKMLLNSKDHVSYIWHLTSLGKMSYIICMMIALLTWPRPRQSWEVSDTGLHVSVFHSLQHGILLMPLCMCTFLRLYNFHLYLS